MGKIKRVFLIILDGLGIGELPDAADYGDVGSNTLRTCFETGLLQLPHMESLGLFNIDGIDYKAGSPLPVGTFARLAEASPGKDTTIGHWEIGGIISERPLPTYPDGFPAELVARIEAACGYKALCNKPYSGTEVLKDYGDMHLNTEKSMILYTSADSVFQVAAHTDVVPIEELYRISQIARDLLVGEHGVGRVIARPFDGQYPFRRTPQRRDFSMPPPRDTVLDILKRSGLETIGVGKIEDIFAGAGLSRSLPKKGNQACMEETEALIKEDFTGLCFVNLVDFDMVFGHRNNAPGFAGALNEFDAWLGRVLPLFREGDVLMLTADHGCDPAPPGTDHTREYVPFLAWGSPIKQGLNLKTRDSFADIGKTILDLFEIQAPLDGISMAGEMGK